MNILAESSVYNTTVTTPYIGGSISNCCGSEYCSTAEEFTEVRPASVAVHIGDKHPDANESFQLPNGKYINLKYTMLESGKPSKYKYYYYG